MKRRLIASLLAVAAALSLCGCGSVFDTEYVVETTYAPTFSAVSSQQSDATIHTLEELKTFLLSMVAEGQNTQRIGFDPVYPGDVSADMASACWQIRTQDALCAYCVENIAYEVYKIVNHVEAAVTVTYSKSSADLEKIVRLPYAADAGEALRQAMAEGLPTLVLFSEYSSFTDETMEDFARQVYREDPAIAPQEPAVVADMISGAGTQRLYELSFDYGMEPSELSARREALAALDPFADADLEQLGEGERALLACKYLIEHCCYAEESPGSVYAALIENTANSAGMAFAYSALCSRLSLSCLIVDGQFNRQDHSWNIVRIDGAYYHVDPAVCSRSGLEAGFLLNDETAWEPYRWDYFNYPHCTGTLTLAALIGGGPEAETREN